MHLFSSPANPLTAAIAAQWLDGLPPCVEITDRHGLGQLSFGAFASRTAFVQEIGFAIPCLEAIQMLAKASPLIEVGAGSAFWSALITEAGGDIIPSDAFAGHYSFEVGRFMPTERAKGHDFVRAHPDRNVLMVWPCYQKSWGAKVAKAVAKDRLLFLVSEGRGGAVGDDRLFQTLADEFEQVGEVVIPQWPGIHDFLSVHRKR